MSESLPRRSPTKTARGLPNRPDLEWYRKAAKKKLASLRIKDKTAKLAEAQLAISNEHGFKSWRKLTAAVHAKTPDNAMEIEAAFKAAAKAITQRDIETVRLWMKKVPEIVNANGSHPNWGGRPQLLHVAIEIGDETIFRALFDAHADPSGSSEGYDGWSPLMLAVHWKRAAMVQLLLERGAEVGIIEALLLAEDATVEKLLPSFNPAFPIPNDGTLLHFARTVTAAEKLMALGVDLAKKDKYGKTALDAAADRGDTTVVKWLHAKGSIATAVTFARLGDLSAIKKVLGRRKPDSDLIRAAVEGGHLKLVKWLAEQGVDVNHQNANGSTPLHAAAWEGNLPMVKLLVKYGANVHTEDDEYGATPTGWAQHAAQNLSRTACLPVIGYLQQKENKIWSVKSLPARRKTHKVTGWKPLMDAAFEGDSSQIKKLIKEGADPNAASTTPGAHRPLHRAIEEKKSSPRGIKHENAVKALLDGGADPTLRGGYDRLTALQLAALDSPQFIPILLDLFKPLDLFHACALLDIKRVETLIKKNPAIVQAKDVNGFSTLHYVAGSKRYRKSAQKAADQIRLAEMLLSAGVSANATYAWPGPDQWSIPVLYMACGRNNNPALTELLLQSGAQPYDNESVYHASDEGHDDCLALIEKYADKKMLAEECTKCLRTQMHWGRTRGAQWLLEHGADPNSLHPDFGNSALHQATKLGSNAKVLGLLLKYGGDPTKKNIEGKTAIELAQVGGKDHVIKYLQRASIQPDKAVPE